MFTGIVEEVGRVRTIERDADSARLEIECTTVTAGTAVGDSIAVSGCCLTVATITDRGFTAELMAETLGATGLGELEIGDRVNLESALSAGESLGGHLVQGHVDGVGEVVGRVEEPGMVTLTVTCPPGLAPYLVPKGSVAVDGASLTVVDVTAHDDGPRFRIGLIPHTLAVTTFGSVAVGDRVNVEVDVIAKYVERLLAAGVETPYTGRRSPS